MKKFLATLAALATLPLAGLAVTAQPAAAAGGCAGPGYLCMYDYESKSYGNVRDSNSNFANFGWNDRADWFRNQGTRCSAVVYSDSDYNQNVWFGISKKYVRGQEGDWKRNYASSNNWVESS